MARGVPLSRREGTKRRRNCRASFALHGGYVPQPLSDVAKVAAVERSGVSPPKGGYPGPVGNQKGHMTTRMRKAIAIAGVLSCAFISYGMAEAKPCEQHTTTTGVTRQQCLKAYRERLQRDREKWPRNPTARDLIVRGVNIRKFLALGRCEAGYGDGYGGVRWSTPSGWKWQGAYGLYYSTHQSVGHPYGADAGSMTWQEQTLVAERVRLRYGIHAWGAASCYIAG